MKRIADNQIVNDGQIECVIAECPPVIPPVIKAKRARPSATSLIKEMKETLTLVKAQTQESQEKQLKNKERELEQKFEEQLNDLNKKLEESNEGLKELKNVLEDPVLQIVIQEKQKNIVLEKEITNLKKEIETNKNNYIERYNALAEENNKLINEQFENEWLLNNNRHNEFKLYIKFANTKQAVLLTAEEQKYAKAYLHNKDKEENRSKFFFTKLTELKK